MMRKPIKTFIYKLIFCVIFLLFGLYMGWVGEECKLGMAIPAMCTVYAVLSLRNCINEVKKSKDKSKVDFL